MRPVYKKTLNAECKSRLSRLYLLYITSRADLIGYQPRVLPTQDWCSTFVLSRTYIKLHHGNLWNLYCKTGGSVEMKHILMKQFLFRHLKIYKKYHIWWLNIKKKESRAGSSAKKLNMDIALNVLWKQSNFVETNVFWKLIRALHAITEEKKILHKVKIASDSDKYWLEKKQGSPPSSNTE